MLNKTKGKGDFCIHDLRNYIVAFIAFADAIIKRFRVFGGSFGSGVFFLLK